MSIYDFKPEIAEFIHTHLGGKLPSNPLVHFEETYKNVEVNIREPIEGYSNYWVLSALGMSISVDATALTSFMSMLEDFDFKRVDSILSFINNSNDKTITVRPYIPVNDLTDESFLEDEKTLGVAYDSVDHRTDRLMKMIFNELGHINRLFEHASTLYNKDIEKVKLDEVFIGYNTKYAGEKTAFFLCATRVPPVLKNGGNNIVRSLTPMEDTLKDLLFGYPTRQNEKAEKGVTTLDDINLSLKRINDGIETHFKMVAEHDSALINEYAINKMNSIVIPAVVMSQTCEFTYFGGQDLNLSDYEEEDANSAACSALIDEELRALFNHLNAIPIPEESGIDHYAIDYDSFGIYGRDSQNKLISAMVDERYQFYTSVESKYSKSFLDIFKQNLKNVKNKHVFTQVGRIVRK